AGGGPPGCRPRGTRAGRGHVRREGGRVKGARLVHWLWQAGPAASLTRLPLVPLALLYRAAMQLRAAAYRRGLLPTQRLPLPAVAVGNLSGGGTGRTPLAAWIARHFAGRGRTAGILLRGYGTGEALAHRRLGPGGG